MIVELSKTVHVHVAKYSYDLHVIKTEDGVEYEEKVGYFNTVEGLVRFITRERLGMHRNTIVTFGEFVKHYNQITEELANEFKQGMEKCQSKPLKSKK